RLKSKPDESVQSEKDQATKLPTSLKKKNVEPSIIEKMKGMGENFSKNVKDYENTILKGSVEGISHLGKIFGPTSDISKTGAKKENQELKQQSENLDKLLPSKEGYAQNSLRRGLRQVPSAIAFHGSVLKSV